MIMETILAIVFGFSTYYNGADFTLGTGFAENDQVFVNPVGIIRAETPVFLGDGWRLTMKGSHLSSIPDPADNWNGSDLNMVSIEFSVRVGGRN